MTARKNRRLNHSVTSVRRARRILCESLENRQLLSMTVLLREANGASSTTISTVGQQITLNIIGQVAAGTAGPSDTNVSASNPSTFGVGSLTGSILSSAPYSQAVAGNLTAAVAQAFNGPGAENGLQQDLNGDGNLDVGSNSTSSASNDYFLGQSGSSEVTTGTVVGNTKQIILGTVVYTVTSLNQGGETDINFKLRPSAGGYFVANWFDGINYQNTSGQGHYANEYLSSLSVGAPFVVTDPALFVAPTAVNDSASVIRNTATSISVLGNDKFVRPPDKSSLLIGTAPAHGTAIPQTDGTVLYTPATGYTGADSFTYTVDDTDGRVSNVGTVSITVTTPPPPVAGAVSASTVRNQPDTITVLSADTVTSPATLVTSSVAVVGVPAHGTAVAQSDGTIIYNPTSGYTGSDSFTYTVQDTNGETSSPGTVSVTVNQPTPPTAGPVSANTTAGAPVTITVLTSDSTPQGSLNAASVTIVTAPTNGTAVAQADGTIIYTPTAKYVGNDSFTYTVADSFGDVSAPGTVSLTVAPGVPPTAGNVTAPAVSGQTNAINVLGNSSSGAPLVPSSVAVVTQPTNGTATVNTSNGTIAYVPNAGYVGTDTFTYTVGNTNLDTSAPATVSVDVGTSIASTKGSPHVLTFTDAAGGLETVSLSKGTAEIFFSGTNGKVTLTKAGKASVTGTNLEISGITLSGTTAASSLSIRGSVKTPVTVGGITDNSPMGSIVATQATLGGTISLAGLGSLRALALNNATIGIGSAGAARFALSTGAVTASTLYSAVPIASLRAASWASQSGVATISINGTSTAITPGGILAPSIASLSVAGGFDVDVTLSTSGRTPTLASARIGGAVGGGVWAIPGPIGAVTFGSVASGWTGTFGTVNSFTIKSGGLASSGAPAFTAGTLGSLNITGDLTTTISASSAKLIRVRGNLSGATVAINGALTTLNVTGAITGSTISTGSSIRSITAGSMNGSNIDAGLVGTVTLANATSTNLGSSTIGSIRLTGRSGDQFTNSEILASKITAASLGSVTTANNGSNFGLGVRSIGTFSGVFAGSPLRVPHNDLVTDTILASFVQQQGDTLGDFEILITG